MGHAQSYVVKSDIDRLKEELERSSKARFKAEQELAELKKKKCRRKKKI
jgi:hypothetical protein